MQLDDLIARAYQEDLPNGDMTTDNLGITDSTGRVRLIAKEDLVLAGLEVFDRCVRYIDPEAEIKWQFQDGDLVLDKQVICWIKGDLRKLLKAERVALNFLGHLSGIATLTRCYVQKTQGTSCKILDTRKTTPLFRELEKKAVVSGGAHNHRMNLSDATLLKENHIRAMGGIAQAIRALRSQVKQQPIEVECSNLQEVELAVRERVERILLDNMSDAEIHEAREKIPSFIQVEVSGNMTLDRIEKVAQLGVDFISVGALTHSAPCADLSLMFEWPLEN